MKIRTVLAVASALALVAAGAGEAEAPGAEDAPLAGFQAYAFVHCVIQKSALAGCEPIAEAPRGLGLGQIAAAVTNGAKSKPAQIGIPGVLIRVCFDNSGPGGTLTATSVGCKVEPVVYTARDLVARPSAEQLLAAYPPKDLAKRKKGEVLLGCTVDAEGMLRYCGIIVSISDDDWNFERAALSLAGAFRVAPLMVDGYPRPGKITVAVDFLPPAK